MNFIIFCIFLFIGLSVGSFGVIQPLIIMFFGIPYTNELYKNDIIKDISIVKKRYYVSLSVLFFITFLATTIIYYFFKSNIFPYYYGIGIAALLGISQIGKNKNNLESYLNYNINYLDIDKFQKIYFDSNQEV
jgi:hypothetical protein